MVFYQWLPNNFSMMYPLAFHFQSPFLLHSRFLLIFRFLSISRFLSILISLFLTSLFLTSPTHHQLHFFPAHNHTTLLYHMEALAAVLRFFSLETLDTRLFPPPDQNRRKQILARAHASRWHTLEFKFYLLVVVLVVPLMYKTAMDALNETNANFPTFQHLLSPGWMFGRQVDNSDQQYRFFRNNFWVLCALVAAHVALRRGLATVFQHRRTLFDAFFGALYVFGLHGFNVVRILVHVVVMYVLATRVRSTRAAKTCLWTYGVLTLFFNDWARHWPLPLLFTGLIPRWDVFYNFTLLRMLSFALDYLERRDELKELEVSPDLDDRGRLTPLLPLQDYSFANYCAYLTYAPLFIGGPIITFNDYMYQSNYFPLQSTRNLLRTAVYGLRLLFCILVMEFLLHFMYVVAVSKTKAWQGDTPFQLSMIGLFNLNIIWLKLLIPWRLFRFWSLLDGIDPPENMIRCMDNNYLALAFWRAWHRSFNRWVVRYIYVPMGGSRLTGFLRIVNTLMVFSFVAVWHDIELKLLMWGWLIVLFLLPEIFASLYFGRFAEKPWYRFVCGVGAVCNIWMMMIANLFGFCLGHDGTVALLHELFGTVLGASFFLVASATLFVGVQVMFELREAEKRRGIDVKC